MASKMKALRIRDIVAKVRAVLERPEIDLPSLARMSEQDLHLLAAALDNSNFGEEV